MARAFKTFRVVNHPGEDENKNWTVMQPSAMLRELWRDHEERDEPTALFVQVIGNLPRSSDLTTAALNVLHDEVNDVFGKFGIAKLKTTQRKAIFTKVLDENLMDTFTDETRDALANLLTASVDLHDTPSKAPLIRIPQIKGDESGTRSSNNTMQSLIQTAFYQVLEAGKLSDDDFIGIFAKARLTGSRKRSRTAEQASPPLS